MRSLTSAFKVRNFIPRDEKVRIPDDDCDASEQTDAIKKVSFAAEAADEAEARSELPEDSHETKPSMEAEILNIGLSFEERPHAKRIGAEEMKQSYEQELRELAASVAQQAYFDALNKKKAELRDCLSEVQVLMDGLVAAHRQFIEEYTSELKYMAVDIAEKMIAEKISEDDSILQRLVMQTVGSVKNAEWLNVEVSARLVSLVDYIKKELDKPEYGGKAFVFPVSGTDSICRVTTNDGTIVSSIEIQAENLRKAFREFDEQQ